MAALLHAFSRLELTEQLKMVSQTDLQTSLAAAFRLFQLALFEEAEAAYREVIGRDRGNAEAWNILGIVLQRQGRVDEGIQALQAAMDFAPRAPEVAVNLANLYKESGDLTKALRLYRKALSLMPEHVGAHVNLANCLVERNAPGDLDVAETHAYGARDLDARSVAAWIALVNIAERRQDYEQAIVTLESALQVFPEDVDLLLHLGGTCMMARRFDSAVDALQHALVLRPRFPEAMNNLGQALFELGRLEEADNILHSALLVRPNMKELLINRANTLVGQRRHADALACFDKVFELDPENASAHFVCGMVHLVEGDFDNGWREYAWRWHLDKYRDQMSSLPATEWRGECLDGKTLYIHAEQGLGDTLQFVRYIPLLEHNGGKVVLAVQPSLKKLLSTFSGVDYLMGKGDSLPSMDFQVPLLNLPGLLGTRLTTIPRQTPYLLVDTLAAATWHTRLDALGAGLKIGIAWAGNPDHPNDHNRSMQLSQIATSFAEVAGVKWISLQKGLGAEQIQLTAQVLDLVDWTGEMSDYADTAALIVGLDLVIAVDTSVVHLAGALNKPVWVMIPYAPDWRWLLDRTDSPWYPSMRLFRQSVRGNWETVINNIVQELSKLTKEANSSLA